MASAKPNQDETQPNQPNTNEGQSSAGKKEEEDEEMAVAADEAEGGDQNNEQAQQKDDEEKQASRREPEVRRHHLLETDDFEQALISAAWFSKQLPKRRNFNSTATATRRGRAQQRNDDASA